MEQPAEAAGGRVEQLRLLDLDAAKITTAAGGISCSVRIGSLTSTHSFKSNDAKCLLTWRSIGPV